MTPHKKEAHISKILGPNIFTDVWTNGSQQNQLGPNELENKSSVHRPETQLPILVTRRLVLKETSPQRLLIHHGPIGRVSRHYILVHLTLKHAVRICVRRRVLSPHLLDIRDRLLAPVINEKLIINLS